jgi:hypothetical protein
MSYLHSCGISITCAYFLHITSAFPMDHVSDRYRTISKFVDSQLCPSTLQVPYTNPSASLPRPLTPPVGFAGSSLAGVRPAGGLPVNGGLAGGLSHLMPLAPASKKILIRGLPRNIDVGTVGEHFHVFGPIAMTYLDTTNGFGHITYSSEGSVERVRKTQLLLSCL